MSRSPPSTAPSITSPNNSDPLIAPRYSLTDRLPGAFGPTDCMEVQVQGLSPSLLIKAEARVK